MPIGANAVRLWMFCWVSELRRSVGGGFCVGLRWFGGYSVRLEDLGVEQVRRRRRSRHNRLEPRNYSVGLFPVGSWSGGFHP
jgi:hypothetical protein